MSARGVDPGDVTWDVLHERMVVKLASARAEAVYWRNRYEGLAGTRHEKNAETREADSYGDAGWPT